MSGDEDEDGREPPPPGHGPRFHGGLRRPAVGPPPLEVVVPEPRPSARPIRQTSRRPRPLRTVSPLLLGLLLVAVVGVPVVLFVRHEQGVRHERWGDSGLFGASRNRILTLVCDDGEPIGETIPFVPGAELQAAIVKMSDQDAGSAFSLDALDEPTYASDPHVTMAVCATVLRATARRSCEIYPGEPVDLVTGVALDLRYVEMHTGEELDHEEVIVRAAGCPDRAAEGILPGIDDEYSMDLIDEIEEAAWRGALVLHAD